MAESPIMNRLKRSLFTRAQAQAQAGEERDVDIHTDSPIEIDQPADDDIQLLAVTVNLCPNTYMNKKRWSTYDHNQQRAQLTRIEKSFRQKTPSCELIKISFEVCPTLDNIHFHALYRCPDPFKSTLINYFSKYAPKKGGDTWRTCIAETCYDLDGWIKYIQKNDSTIE